MKLGRLRILLKHNIERLDTRLSAVESSLDIKPQEDLLVPHFAE